MFAAAAGALHFMVPRWASAQDNWNVFSGDWSAPEDWSPVGVPAAGATVNIVGSGGTQTIDFDYNYGNPPMSAPLGELTISNSSNTGQTNLLEFDEGPYALTVQGEEYIGGNNSGVTGIGTIIQPAGNNNILSQMSLGYNAGDNGYYSLSGGTVSAADDNTPNEIIGYNGTGTFVQSSGPNTFGDAIYIGDKSGSQGYYTLSSVGTLTTSGGQEYVGEGAGSTGTFTQTGGINMISGGGLFVGFSGQGQYNLSSGTLSFTSGSSLSLGSGGFGTFTQTGGAVNIDSTGVLTVGVQSPGSYFLQAGSLTVGDKEIVGQNAAGIVIQTGGSNSVSGDYLSDLTSDFILGSEGGSTGTYDLEGGMLSTGPAAIGVGGGGKGTLTLSNTGEMSISNILYVDSGAVSANNEHVGGGMSSVVAGIVIGAANNNNGTITQIGGTNTANELDIGEDFSAQGAYNLRGGTAVFGGVNVGFPAQSGEFTFTGGTGFLTVTSTGQMTVNNLLTLYNGVVSAPNEILGGVSNANATLVVGPGGGGVGAVNQDGGTNNATEVDIGASSSAIGTYNLGGGSVSVADSVYVGFPEITIGNPQSGFTVFPAGTGYLTVTGSGQLFVNNTLTLVNGSISAPAGESIGGGTSTFPLNPSIEVGPQTAAGGGAFNQTGGTNTTQANLILGYSADTIGTYNLSGGTLSVAESELVGVIGSGQFNQTGGMNTIGGALLITSLDSNYSTYNLSNPAWPSCTLMFTSTGMNIDIDAEGQFNIYGNIGTPPANTLPAPGQPASLPSNYQGGYLQDPGGIVSGPGQIANDGGFVDPAELDLTGSFTQTGGIANFGQIDDDGAISISGGLVVATAGEYVGNNATGSFSLSSAINIIGNSNGLVVGNTSGATGWFTLGASGVLTSGGSEIVGLNGAGNFDQTGGSNTIATNGFYYLTLGNNAGSTGSYALSGTGSLSSSYEFVGAIGAGTFNQSGGINSVNVSLSIGNNPGGMGLYAMSAGTLTAGQIAVGPVGTGTFNQSGGLVTVGAAGLSLGANAGSSGTYVLSGGMLTAPNIYVGGSSTGAGGTGVLTVSNSGQLSVSRTLKVYSTGRVNLDVPSISVGNLAIAGNSTINVNGALTINYGSPGNDPVSSIVTLLRNGFNGGAWTGTATASIISTSVSAGPSKPILSVGYADGNSDNGTAAGSNQIVVRYTMAGDANLDGHVNSADLLAVIQNFDKTGTDWAHGNFTYVANGQSTTSADLLLVVQNFNQTLPPPAGSAVTLGGTTIPLSQFAPVQSSVPLPEPGSVGVALVAAAGWLARRRRKPRRDSRLAG
jgi:hypothetical protein